MFKSDIRALFKEKRKGLSFFEVNRRSTLITDSILDKFHFAEKYVSIFLPIEKNKEFNSYPLLEELQIRNAIPVVSRSNFENATLQLFQFDNSSQLKVNTFGIPEPIDGVEVTEADLDIVFVPLLAFDVKGNRVGYGKGFYDKLLSKCKKNCVFVGISLFDEFLEIEDLHENDIRLHFCFTPTTIYEFR